MSPTRLGALQFAVLVRVRGRIFKFEVGALAASRRRKMLALDTRDFERIFAIVMHDGIDAGHLDDLPGLYELSPAIVASPQ